MSCQKLLILSSTCRCPSRVQMLATFYYSHGYAVFTAATSMEAADILRREEIDCVLMETRVLDGSTEPFYQAFLVPAPDIAVVVAAPYNEVPPNFVQMIDAYTVALPARLEETLVTIREAIGSAQLSIVPVHVRSSAPEAVA